MTNDLRTPTSENPVWVVEASPGAYKPISIIYIHNGKAYNYYIEEDEKE